MAQPFERVKKWENELNICIRCGYCYENCHLVKLDNWESNSPRGKLSLLYGLISGRLQPSQQIAEKLFECFYCKNCSKNCSAKVSVTDIFTAAREDLVEQGFSAEGVTAKVDQDTCSTCGICVSVCKAEAIKVDREKKEIILDKVKCQGCGSCIAACPSGIITQKHGYGITASELTNQIDAILEHSTEGKPKVVVFLCNWQVHPGLHISKMVDSIEQKDLDYGIIINVCAGRIGIDLILYALEHGATGVMVGACPFEECEHDGNYRIKARVHMLKNMLTQIGINPQRVKLDYFARTEGAKFVKSLNSFIDEVKALGPIKEGVKTVAVT
jgi:coenzyme F420-reducing hydrogenase delta subunit/heterodisulfide reductase subunit C